jgi:hypothetical protein
MKYLFSFAERATFAAMLGTVWFVGHNHTLVYVAGSITIITTISQYIGRFFDIDTSERMLNINPERMMVFVWHKLISALLSMVNIFVWINLSFVVYDYNSPLHFLPIAAIIFAAAHLYFKI